MQIVRCNSCGEWIGRDEDLGLNYGDDTEYCPNCKSTEALMDVDCGCNFDDTELEKLWRIFGDVPVDDSDGVLEEFLGFPEGTDRIEIWQWFDERYTKGVVSLLYPEGVAGKMCGRCGSGVLPETDEELKRNISISARSATKICTRLRLRRRKRNEDYSSAGGG